jgi:hypothetical protein
MKGSACAAASLVVLVTHEMAIEPPRNGSGAATRKDGQFSNADWFPVQYPGAIIF